MLAAFAQHKRRGREPPFLNQLLELLPELGKTIWLVALVPGSNQCTRVDAVDFCHEVLTRQTKGRFFHDRNSRDLHVQKTCDIAQREIVIVITLKNQLRERPAELAQYSQVIFWTARGLLFFLFQFVVKFLKCGALAVVKSLRGAAKRQQPA